MSITNGVESYRFVASRDSGERFQIWRMRVEAWIQTTLLNIPASQRGGHGLNLLKLLSFERAYLDTMELSSSAETALGRLQLIYGLSTEEQRLRCFKSIGRFGPEDESVNAAIMRLRVLLKRSDELDIPLTVEFRVLLLRKVLPESATGFASMETLKSYSTLPEAEDRWNQLLVETSSKFGSMRLRTNRKTTPEVALMTERRNSVMASNTIPKAKADAKTEKVCNFCRKRGHEETQCWSKQKREPTSGLHAMVDQKPSEFSSDDEPHCF